MDYQVLQRRPETSQMDLLLVAAKRDQIEDYATRKRMPVREVERWLSPILNYVPMPETEAAE